MGQDKISLFPVKDKNTSDNFELLVKELNLLKNSVNAQQQSLGFNFAGKEGDIQISEDVNKRKHININTKDGWFTSFDGCFERKTKDGRYILKLYVIPNTAPSTVSAGSVTNRYGGVDNFLGDPSEWFTVIDSTTGITYKIPAY